MGEMKKIHLKDYGIKSDTDITLELYSVFEKYPEDTEFIFEKGRYYFSPFDSMKQDYRVSNSDVYPDRTLAIWMREMKNCILRGNGSELILRGHMQVFTLDRCENILIDGFVVDWEKPLVAEGEIVAIGEEYVDVFVDNEKFPHRFNGSNLEFDVGADEWYGFIKLSIIYEKHGMTVRKGTGDYWLKEITKIGENLYRFEPRPRAEVALGDILVLRHNMRKHAGIFSEKCKDLSFDNITFHSCGGLGCLAQFCHNLTYRGIHFINNVGAGRAVSNGRDDGMHLTCNSGTVTITECSFFGLMDDPINIHGCCVTSDEALDEYTLRCKYRHVQACGFHYWAEFGDEIAFIDRKNMSRIGTLDILEYVLEDKDTFVLKFSKPVPKEILSLAQKGDSLALDNLTNTAEFICTKNRFGSCRARGLLVSTPKRVLIEENYFESSGSAILVAGDSNYWFESGECRDVEIRNNVFSSACLTSDYEFCKGVISIYPIIPSPEIEKPYHKNIKIINNVFDVSNAPLLYAFSCDNLEFSENKIYKSPYLNPMFENEKSIKLYYCTNSKFRKNSFIGKFDYSSFIESENCLDIIEE